MEQVFESELDKEVSWSMSYYGEEVLELEAGVYVDYAVREIGHLGYDEYGNSIPLPDSARTVHRGINGGSYAIFLNMHYTIELVQRMMLDTIK